MERRLVREPGLEEPAAEPVENGVRRLVGHHVVREAGVDGRTVRRTLRHVAEQQRPVLPGVVGIPLGESVRHQVELVAGEGPRDSAAQRGLERRQGACRHGVDLLGVERAIRAQRLVVGLGEGVAVRGQQGRIGVRPRGHVEVDDVEAWTARSRLEADPRHVARTR